MLDALCRCLRLWLQRAGCVRRDAVRGPVGSGKGDWEIALAGEWQLVGIAERSFLDGLVRRGESRGTLRLQGHEYEVDLAAMTQKNMSTGKKWRIRRVFEPTSELNRASRSFFSTLCTPSRSPQSSIAPPEPEPVEVRMNVYDLGTDFKVQTVNGILGMLGSGVYHAAIEVYGLEWSYGYCVEGTGVFRSAPRECQAHSYRSSEVLGTVETTRHDVEELLRVMSAEWQGQDYDLLRRNCCHFSDAFARRLGTKPLPSWVLSAARLGAGLDDSYGWLQEVMAKGTVAKGAHPLTDTYTHSDVVRGLVAEGREDHGVETPRDSSGTWIEGQNRTEQTSHTPGGASARAQAEKTAYSYSDNRTGRQGHAGKARNEGPAGEARIRWDMLRGLFGVRRNSERAVCGGPDTAHRPRMDSGGTTPSLSPTVSI
jgi:hypothetical protein